MVGGNGREPQFCVSVCVRPVPRKTRPERRWDLISAWRHGRKLVPLGGGRRGGGVLHVLPKKRKKKRERFRDRTAVLFTRTVTNCVGVVCFKPVRHVTSAAPASNTFTVITESGTSRCRSSCHREVSSVQSLVYLHLDRTAAEPEGHHSEHVQRISTSYAAFIRLKNPLLLSLHVTHYSECVQQVLILFVTGFVFTASRQLRNDADFQGALW